MKVTHMAPGAALLAAILVFATAGTTPAKESVKGLVANLHAKVTHFTAGEPMEFELAIKNVSDKELTLPDGAAAWSWTLQFGHKKKKKGDWLRTPSPKPLTLAPQEAKVIQLGAGDGARFYGDQGWQFMWTGAQREPVPPCNSLPEGRYPVKAVYSPIHRESGAATEGALESNEINIHVGQEWCEAVNGLRLGLIHDDKGYRLRWENVGKTSLTLLRDRCCDLYDHVFIKGPNGRIVPARQDNRVRLQHAQAQIISLEAGKTDQDSFDPWFWVVKPDAPGEYTVWVEFEQKERQAVESEIPGYWKGKVRSNVVKVVIPEQTIAWGKAVNGLRIGVRLNKFAFAPGDDIHAESFLNNESDKAITSLNYLGDFGWQVLDGQGEAERRGHPGQMDGGNYNETKLVIAAGATVKVPRTIPSHMKSATFDKLPKGAHAVRFEYVLNEKYFGGNREADPKVIKRLWDEMVNSGIWTGEVSSADFAFTVGIDNKGRKSE